MIKNMMERAFSPDSKLKHRSKIAALFGVVYPDCNNLIISKHPSGCSAFNRLSHPLGPGPIHHVFLVSPNHDIAGAKV